MAQNDIIVAKEGVGGVLAEIALAPADIGAATTESTVAKAKALVDEFTGDPALIYTSEGSNGWTTLTDPASFRTALELSTNGNAAGLYDNTAGQVGAVVNDFSLRINGDGVSADLDTANLTASRGYELPNASGTIALNPMTTAGDIVVGGTSGAPARLALGTASQQLRVNSGATSLEYFTPAAAFDPASPGAIGNTTPAAITGTTGTFTTLTANTSLTLNGTGAAELVNGTSAAGDFRIYRTTSSANANYERGFIRWGGTSSNTLQIGTEKLGTGAARALEFQTDGVTRLAISATGDVGIGATSAPTGGFGSVVIGQLNTASGNATYVMGRDSVASSTWAVALAYRSRADRNAMLSFAAGRFASNGDAQNAKFVLRCTTTTNAAVEMFMGDTTTTYLTIPSGKVIFCNIKVVGTKSDGSVVATYERQYAAKNVAGTSSEVYAAVTIGTDNAASTSLEIATVDAGDYIRIRPTGIASETWRWVASVDAVEVAYGA
jgi:hypothetical protein